MTEQTIELTSAVKLWSEFRAGEVTVEGFSKALIKELAADPEVKEFDFAILLPMVLQFLVQWLGDCGQTPSEAYSQIERRSFWARYACSLGIKRAAAEEGLRRLPSGTLSRGSELILKRAAGLDATGFGLLVEDIRRQHPAFDEVWS